MQQSFVSIDAKISLFFDYGTKRHLIVSIHSWYLKDVEDLFISIIFILTLTRSCITF